MEALIATVVTFALGFVWTKAEKIIKALKELGETLTVLSTSLEDGTLTAEEAAKIKKEILEDVAAFKAILK